MKVEPKEEFPKLAIKGSTLAELAKEMKAAKAKAKRAEKQMEQYKSLVHRIAIGPLAKLMEDAELDFFNVPGIGSLEYGIEVYPSYLKADTEAVFDWLRKIGDGHLIKETVHHKTLQGWAVSYLSDADNEAPPDILKLTKIPTVAIKAPKKSSKLKK